MSALRAMDDEQLSFMDYLWVSEEDGVVTIGISEEAAEDLTDELILNLPEEEDEVAPGKVCGDIESVNGNLNIYSPVHGIVLEVNEAALDNPELIMEDPLDEGWLLKIEATDLERIDKLKDLPTTGEEEPEEIEEKPGMNIDMEDIEEDY